MAEPKRAMLARARDVFIETFSEAHRWLDELLSDAGASIATLAAREAICLLRKFFCTRQPHVRTNEKFIAPPIAELASGIMRPTHFSAASAPSLVARRPAIFGATFSNICFSTKSLP